MSPNTPHQATMSLGTGAVQTLIAHAFPLWGSRLIEASAGTGKTWTIAALYVRLILGHGATQAFARPLMPAEILVMTFTRAATRELSDRIRARLLAAARVFRGEVIAGHEDEANDPFLLALMLAYPDAQSRDEAAWRLATAAQSMDDASVHTIDAWCQRMLREHAFDSGSLFDEELVADEDAMQLEAAQDYWRQSCYPLGLEPLQQVLGVWHGIDAFTQDMRNLRHKYHPEQNAHQPTGSLAQVLDCAVQLRQAQLDALKAGWAHKAQAMLDWLDGQVADKKNGWNGAKLKRNNYSNWLATLMDWADNPAAPNADGVPDLKAGWTRLTANGLRDAHKSSAAGITIPDEFNQLEQLKKNIQQVPELAVALRAHAASGVRARLAQLKQQGGCFGFADMLERLNRALQCARGERLRERIRTQYPVALIDEFQDTSPLQLNIFDQVYRIAENDKGTALLLIGDPKQSIYGFRGADIYSYLNAREATLGRHYMLGTNYRSTKALVASVNHWFEQADAQLTQGAFLFGQPPGTPLPFVAVQAKGRKEQLVTQAGPLAPMTIVHDLQSHKADDIRRLFAARCAEQIVTWLNDGQACYVEAEEANKPLRPKDIAVLVRTGREATAVRRELRQRGVPSVYLSDKDSVLQSDEAKDLVYWLRGVAMPQEVRLVRAALATRILGMTLVELENVANDDETYDACSAQLQNLHAIWKTQGVLAMLRQTLHQFGLAARWLTVPDGERKLTNFLHLAELLQTASALLDGEQALIRWLVTEIQDDQAQSDEQIVRLESDADLVKVITIHKSKGLEYPVVCLPFASGFRSMVRKNTGYIELPAPGGTRKLLLQYSDDELDKADKDRLREEVRLFYVALTRARHALWLGFAAQTTFKGEKCQNHKGAAGYLIGGPEVRESADEWLEKLTQLAEGQPGISLQPGAAEPACTRLLQAADQAELRDAPLYAGGFDKSWTIASFSRLSRGMAAQASELAAMQASKAAEDEAEPSGPAMAAPLPAGSVPRVCHTFMRGPLAGNFLHEQLEWLTAHKFALQDNPALLERLTRRCAGADKKSLPEDVASWLADVVQTRLLGPDAALAELDVVLPEMEFWLPAESLDASRIDALCTEHLLPGVLRPKLPQSQLHGMLMGFADLVFEHQGRYWVLDYKSNHLGPDDGAYSQAALNQAMAQHRYDVQAAIYLLALHRLLQSRLGAAYQPEQHLGGAVYLFLRGIHGPRQGVCLLPAPLVLLHALDAMLGNQEISA